MYAEGITRSTPAISAAMERATQAARQGLSPHPAIGAAGAAAGAGAARQVIQLEFVGGANDALWTLIKKNIRIKGGNVQLVGA